ncbi:alpha/beta hydrolase fold domain-containing protein [Microbacterium sp. NPDC091313]
MTGPKTSGYIPPEVKPLAPPRREPRYEDVRLASVPLDDGSTIELRFDVYQSADQTEPGPCVVYFFGGGWMDGDYKQRTSQKAVYIRDLVELTDRGLTVVSASYRLVQQAAFPACVHDAKALIRHLKAHGPDYLIDPERIGVLGNSAGGHLAALIALTPGDADIEGEVGDDLGADSSVAAAALYYAPLDLLAMAGANGPRDASGSEVDDILAPQETGLFENTLGYDRAQHGGRSLDQLWADGEGEQYAATLRRFSPQTHVRADAPPLLILHGGHDALVPLSQSEDFYHALVAAGADATYLTYSRGAHGPSLGSAVDAFAYEFLISRL